MSVTDADRIAAAGIPLTLGGREVRVRFTLRSWKEAEDRFGSMEEALAVLRRLINDEEPKPVAATMALLWAGLLHEGLTLDDVYDLGSIHERPNYAQAVLQAISDGTPRAGSGKEAAAASPGTATTTPSPSDTDAAMASSGV